MTSQLRKGLQNRADASSSAIKGSVRKFKGETEDQYGDLQDTERRGYYGAPADNFSQRGAAARGVGAPGDPARPLDIDHPSFEVVRFPKDSRDERMRMKATLAHDPSILGWTEVSGTLPHHRLPLRV